jgi:hypothetical protein
MGNRPEGPILKRGRDLDSISYGRVPYSEGRMWIMFPKRRFWVK